MPTAPTGAGARATGTRDRAAGPSRRSLRRAGVLAAAVAVPALAMGAYAPAPAAADGAAAGGAHTGVRACESSDYKLIYEGREAAAGTMYIRFSMARIMGDGPGEEPCVQHTPVSMHWIDTLGGERVGDWARYDDDPPEPFVVEPGGVADLTVRQPNPLNYPEEDCEPRPVAGIQVYLRFEDDDGVYGPTGGQDVMCSLPGAGVPTVFVEPSGA
ncbi:hypothetical protein [Nocardiopsis chromatogenes]|uniref:hypothetical protein n=1 Tax=Nocardiopsis chromatogenes TaxID=280239 RepID=UPI000594B56C|nr:hypothetical protein [Nocardiopsis chromatogenes]